MAVGGDATGSAGPATNRHPQPRRDCQAVSAMLSGMRTHEHHVDGPDDDTRALPARLADHCKADPALFAALVRQNDQLRAVGVDSKTAWRMTLEAFEKRSTA